MSDSQADLRRALRSAYQFGDDYPNPGLLARISAEISTGQQRRGTGWPFAGAMAAALAILIVTVFVLIPRQTAQTQGPVAPTSASITGLVGFQFVSAQIGWVHLEPSNGTDVIAKTSDGGRTWHRQLTLTSMTPASTMQWVDPQNGVVVGQSGKSSVIWRTADGGTHWVSSVVSVSSSAPLGDWFVLTGYFLDTRDGWLLYGRDYGLCAGCIGPRGGLLYGTTDGGNQWTQLGSVPPDLNGYWPRLRFFTPSLGVVSNGIGAGLAPIYTTRDGGRTWAPFDVPLALPGCGVGPPCAARLVDVPTFFSATAGALTAAIGSPVDIACPAASPGALPSGGCRITTYKLIARYVYTSADGGISWNLSRNLLDAEGQLIFVDPKRWIDVEPNSLRSTDDGGAVWSDRRSIPIPAGWYVSDAKFLDAGTGFITVSNVKYAASIASAGNFQVQGNQLRFEMLATSDGGATWRPISLPSQ